jgi:hypothetical protein
MHAAAPRSLSRSLLHVPCAAAILAFASLLPGCCESWEGDICAVMDPEVTACPSAAELEGAAGGEVVSGPEVRYYVDTRSDADPFTSRGMLCCYRIKHTSCGTIELY